MSINGKPLPFSPQAIELTALQQIEMQDERFYSSFNRHQQGKGRSGQKAEAPSQLLKGSPQRQNKIPARCHKS
jgi:hypothetical protein